MKIILALMLSGIGVISNAQKTPGYAVKVELDRCSDMLSLDDSNFTLMRTEGSLQKQLDELHLFINADSYPDSIIKKKAITEALTQLNYIADRYPKYSRLLILRGNALYKLDNKNANEALALYKKAMKYHDGPYFDGLYNSGCIELESNSYKRANEFFLKANKAKPDYDHCTYNLADSYVKLKKYDDALHWYYVTLQLSPDNNKAYYNLGKVYGRYKNQLDSAITYISLALSIDSTVEVYYEDLGVAYGLSGRYDSAIAVAKKCLEKFPDYIPALENLAISYDKKDEKELAEEYRDKIKAIQEKTNK